MNPEQAEWTWLDARQTITFSELTEVCGMSASELNELLDYGALVPADSARPEPVFSAACVMPLRAAGKLRVDFDLDLFTVSILLDYLGRIERLENQLVSLRAHLPAHVTPPLP